MSEALNRALAEIAGPEVYAISRKRLGYRWEWEDLPPGTRENWIREEQQVISPVVDALKAVFEEDSPAGAELRELLS